MTFAEHEGINAELGGSAGPGEPAADQCRLGAVRYEPVTCELQVGRFRLRGEPRPDSPRVLHEASDRMSGPEPGRAADVQNTMASLGRSAATESRPPAGATRSPPVLSPGPSGFGAPAPTLVATPQGTPTLAAVAAPGPPAPAASPAGPLDAAPPVPSSAPQATPGSTSPQRSASAAPPPGGEPEPGASRRRRGARVPWAVGVLAACAAVASIVAVENLIKKGLGRGTLPIQEESPLAGRGSARAGQVEKLAPSGAAYAYVPGGTFTMGCVVGDSQCDSDEKPAHRVTLSRGFWMKVTEVSVGEYRAFASLTGRLMPTAPGFRQSEDHPVVNVDWGEAEAYCQWAGGRLPSEAEWERAARGGREGLVYSWGNEVPVCVRGARDGARYDDNGRCDAENADTRGSDPVGSYAANGYGLYDMAGNTWEWCADWYEGRYSVSVLSVDPRGPSTGNYRVLRGGAWCDSAADLRVSGRRRVPSIRYGVVGFRCLKDS